MASINYNDITPEENQRLTDAQKQHEEQLQASKNLEDTIKQLAANNRRDGNKDKIAYTENRLAIREYSDSMRNNMSSETSKLFEQLEDINVESRKQTKSEQRENLKQLEVLKELSKNIQDEEHRLELQKFVDSTEESIRMNTNKFTSFVSKSMDNFGDIGAILSGLNDSPLLSMGFAYFGNKISDSLRERREQKYSLQEGSEDQLFELLQEREKSAKKQEAILQEIAKRQTDNPDSEQDPNNDVKLDDDSLAQLSNDDIENQLKLSNDELVSINDNINDLQNIPDNTSKEPTIENNQDIVINNVESDLDLSKLTNDEVINQLDFANEQLLSIDDSIQNLQKIPDNKSNDPTIESVVNNTINIPDFDLSDINLSSLQDLLEEANYELISINSSIQDFLNNTIAIDKNSSQDPIQIPLNDEQRDLSEEMIYQLLDINEKLAPLLNGLEERKRESELYNDQLLTAIQNLKGDSSIAGKAGKDDGSELGKVFDVLKISLGGVLGGFIGSMVSNFKSVLKNVAKAIPKLLSKLFLPVTIVMGLFSGVTEAIDEFKKTGSVKDAVIGFFGGILDFLTFGLLGTDSINSVVDSISSYIQPLFDTLKKPFEYVSNWLDGIFGAENMDSAFDFLRKLNPVTIMIDNIKFMFESVTKLIDNIMNIDYGKIISEQVKSMLPDNVIGDKIKGLFEDDDTEPTKKRQLNERQLKIIETKRARMREHINGVYKVNDIPMNKQDYKQASNAVLKPESSNAGGNNSFSNINVANNNQTIVAPLPTVHNDDYYIRNRLSNNPY